MPYATTKLVQRADKRRADGTAPVYVRITANRKSRYKATGVYVEPRHWNDKRQEVRSSHEIPDALNAKLRDTLNEARELSLDAPSAKAVQAKLGGAGGSLTDYFQQFIDRLDAKGKLWEYRKYKVTLGKLQDCLGTELAWREVDRDALTKFERYLREWSDPGSVDNLSVVLRPPVPCPDTAPPTRRSSASRSSISTARAVPFETSRASSSPPK